MEGEFAQSSSTTLAATRTYDAFGATTASTGTWSGTFGYAGAFGYQEDSDSGLKLLGNRYYDSSLGRFISRDPIKDGNNWYSYCGGNPIGFVDPTGYNGKRDFNKTYNRLKEIFDREIADRYKAKHKDPKWRNDWHDWVGDNKEGGPEDGTDEDIADAAEHLLGAPKPDESKLKSPKPTKAKYEDDDQGDEDYDSNTDLRCRVPIPSPNTHQGDGDGGIGIWNWDPTNTYLAVASVVLVVLAVGEILTDGADTPATVGVWALATGI